YLSCHCYPYRHPYCFMVNETEKNSRADYRSLCRFTNDSQFSSARFSYPFFRNWESTCRDRLNPLWTFTHHAQYIYRGKRSVSTFKRGSYGNGNVLFQTTYQSGVTYCYAYHHGRNSNFDGSYRWNNNHRSFNRGRWTGETYFAWD